MPRLVYIDSPSLFPSPPSFPGAVLLGYLICFNHNFIFVLLSILLIYGNGVFDFPLSPLRVPFVKGAVHTYSNAFTRLRMQMISRISLLLLLVEQRLKKKVQLIKMLKRKWYRKRVLLRSTHQNFPLALFWKCQHCVQIFLIVWLPTLIFSFAFFSFQPLFLCIILEL